MSYKGNITEIVNAARIVDGIEITSLPADGYTSPAGNPFAIKLIPKAEDNYKEFEFIQGQLFQSDSVKEWPVDILSWSSELFVNFPFSNNALLTNYRIFLGFGSDIQNV